MEFPSTPNHEAKTVKHPKNEGIDNEGPQQIQRGFQEIQRMLNTDNTIKAYLHWLDLGLLRALKADGQKQKTLARWQLQAKLVLKRTEKDSKKTRQTPPLEQLKKGAAKLP